MSKYDRPNRVSSATRQSLMAPLEDVNHVFVRGLLPLAQCKELHVRSTSTAMTGCKTIGTGAS